MGNRKTDNRYYEVWFERGRWPQVASLYAILVCIMNSWVGVGGGILCA